MSIEQFTVQPTSIVLMIVTVGVLALGTLLFAAGFSRRLRETIANYSLKAHPSENRFIYLIVGALVIGIGITIFAATCIPSTITVGSGYVSFQSMDFFGAGSMKIASGQIANAYIGQLGQGDLKISRTFGTSDGNINLGLFTLANGKTAHVITNNQTSLIIELNTGDYVILGTSDTEALAASFSQNVCSLKPT